MAQKIPVNLGNRSYDIVIKVNCLNDIAEYISLLKTGKKAFIITNDVVGRWYLRPVAESLDSAGYSVVSYTIADGEQTKSMSWLEKIYHAMLDAKLDRHSIVIALGGGVIGDLAGFAAATYMRGIPYIQVPTTLLAQVDSSVGGKTGINLKEGKNLVGAFYQPKLVVIDPAVLKTLPERELKAGFAEVIKYGIIRDEEFFCFLEKNIPRIFKLEPECIEHIVSTSCRIKADVVEKDERESNLRAILNFGHTVGHALEAVTDYAHFVHGEAVAIGMVVACALGEQCLGFPTESTRRVKNLIHTSGLPYLVPKNISNETVIDFMRHDKKVKDDTLVFVLPKKIGEVSIVSTVSVPEIMEALDASRRE